MDRGTKTHSRFPVKTPEPNGCRLLLTKEEAAEMLGITVGHFRVLLRARKIPVVRLGYHTIRFRQADLERAIERLTEKAIV